MTRTTVKYTQPARDITGGMVRGAGSIGKSLLMSIDYSARRMGVRYDYLGRNDRQQMLD